MFRKMRRDKQLLAPEETVEILKACTSGVLAVHGDNGYPYAVPVSHAYDQGKLYFHSAKDGHKLDSIVKDEKVSFCVIQKDEVIPETFTTHFRSVIVFGRARVLTDADERMHAMRVISAKFSPQYPAEGQAEIERSWDRFNVIEVMIDHMTGKEAIELVRLRSA